MKPPQNQPPSSAEKIKTKLIVNMEMKNKIKKSTVPEPGG